MIHALAVAFCVMLFSVVGARLLVLAIPPRRPWALRVAEFRWQLRTTLVAGGVLLVAWVLTH